MSFFDDYEKSEMNRHAAEPKIQPTSIENVVKVFKNVEQNFYEPSYKKVKTLSLAKEEEKEKGFFFRDGVLKDEDGDVSNFYAKLEKSYEIIDDRGNEVQCFDVEFMVFRNGGMRKHSIKMVWASDLKSGKVLAKVPFHVIYVDRSKFSAIWGKYVNELIEEFDGEEVILYAKAGWKELNGKWIYVDGQKAIGIPDSNCKALTNRVINSSIDSKSHYNFFAEMLQVVKDMPKMAVLLLYVFASFIYKILAEVGFPLKFSLVLVGPRGCRKTSLGLCFSQLENKTSPKLNFNATKAGIQS